MDAHILHFKQLWHNAASEDKQLPQKVCHTNILHFLVEQEVYEC